MRVILVLVLGALALPAFAGSSPPETMLPDTSEEILESAVRTGEADDAIGLVEGIADDPTAKEHSSQADDPDFPHCEGGG
jgi:hypothetical protein